MSIVGTHGFVTDRKPVLGSRRWHIINSIHVINKLHFTYLHMLAMLTSYKHWMTWCNIYHLYDILSACRFIMLRCFMVAMLCCHLVTVMIKKTLLLFTSSRSIDIIPNTNSSIRIDITIKLTYCLYIDLKYIFNT